MAMCLHSVVAEVKVSSHIYTSLKDNSSPLTLQVGEETTNYKDCGKKRLRIECVNTCDMFVSGYTHISRSLLSILLWEEVR